MLVSACGYNSGPCDFVSPTSICPSPLYDLAHSMWAVNPCINPLRDMATEFDSLLYGPGRGTSIRHTCLPEKKVWLCLESCLIFKIFKSKLMNHSH